MLIEDGDADAALDILGAPIAPAEESAFGAAPHTDTADIDDSTAETWRLRAPAYLLLKRLPSARQRASCSP
jgi:hypothetical protein